LKVELPIVYVAGKFLLLPCIEFFSINAMDFSPSPFTTHTYKGGFGALQNTQSLNLFFHSSSSLLSYFFLLLSGLNTLSRVLAC